MPTESKPETIEVQTAQAVASTAVLDRVWGELASQGRPPTLTKGTISKLFKALATDREFWADLLDRHGLRNKRLAELDAHTREHAIGNFWGMLAQSAHELRQSN